MREQSPHVLYEQHVLPSAQTYAIVSYWDVPARCPGDASMLARPNTLVALSFPFAITFFSPRSGDEDTQGRWGHRPTRPSVSIVERGATRSRSGCVNRGRRWQLERSDPDPVPPTRLGIILFY